jgi:hypothetical protein
MAQKDRHFTKNATGVALVFRILTPGQKGPLAIKEIDTIF